MSEIRDKRIESFYTELAAKFLEENSASPSYMITVTGIDVSKNHQYVKVLFTVLPDSYEETALRYARSLRSEFRELVKSQSKMKVIPTFEFDIDRGEKHRQKIDVLIKNNK